MMDFSLPCWKNVSHRLLLSWVLGLAWLGLASQAAWGQTSSAEIVQLQAERLDDGVFVTARINIELAPAVEDALLKGIPVQFVAQAQLVRERWYWYDKKIQTATKPMRLSYQPLTRHWRVSLISGAQARAGEGISLNQTFDTLTEALQSISWLSHWKIAEAAEMDSSATHTVNLSFRLDSSDLPRPLQFGLLGQSDWALSASKSQRVTFGVNP